MILPATIMIFFGCLLKASFPAEGSQNSFQFPEGISSEGSLNAVSVNEKGIPKRCPALYSFHKQDSRITNFTGLAQQMPEFFRNMRGER
jgi:hypothetical protein